MSRAPLHCGPRARGVQPTSLWPSANPNFEGEGSPSLSGLRLGDVGEALRVIGLGLPPGVRALLALQLVRRGERGLVVVIALLDRRDVLGAVLRLGEGRGGAQGERQGKGDGRLSQNVLHRRAPLQSWVGFRSAVRSFASKKIGKRRAIDGDARRPARP